MRKLLIFVVVVIGLYWWFHRSDDLEPGGAAHSISQDVPESQPKDNESGAGRPVTTHYLGSGHEAGYEWAERKGITDSEDCDAAGEHSNSPSFAEGCNAYVEEHR